jgi:hypothetical protein
LRHGFKPLQDAPCNGEPGVHLSAGRMRRMAWIAASILLLVAMWLVGMFVFAQMFGVSEITYRGETFQENTSTTTTTRMTPTTWLSLRYLGSKN